MQCLNCNEDIVDETKNVMFSEFIIHYHPHTDFSGKRLNDHYCSMSCFMKMNENQYPTTEVYDVSIYNSHELFFSFEKASMFGEKVIKELYNDVSSIEWRFSEYDNDIMVGWVDDECVAGRIRRKYLNRDVETAMNAFHNDD